MKTQNCFGRRHYLNMIKVIKLTTKMISRKKNLTNIIEYDDW